MKLATRILSLLVLAAFATFYMSCDGGGGDDQSEEQVQFNKLKSDWLVDKVLEDGDDRTLDFQGTTLTLEGNFVQGGSYLYSFEGPMPDISPFPRTGSWRFGEDPSSQIIRDQDENELDMTYEFSGDNNTLVIFLNVPEGHPGWGTTGRGKSVTGDWEFTFTKVQ
jgi:hypothetical protein